MKWYYWFTPTSVCVETWRVLEVSWANNMNGWNVIERTHDILWLNDRINWILQKMNEISDDEIMIFFEELDWATSLKRFHNPTFGYLSGFSSFEKTALYEVAFARTLEKNFSVPRVRLKKLVMKSMTTGRWELIKSFTSPFCNEDIDIFFTQFNSVCKDKLSQMKKWGKSCPAVYCEDWKIFIDQAYTFMDERYYPLLQSFLKENFPISIDTSHLSPTMRLYYGIDS